MATRQAHVTRLLERVQVEVDSEGTCLAAYARSEALALPYARHSFRPVPGQGLQTLCRPARGVGACAPACGSVGATSKSATSRRRWVASARARRRQRRGGAHPACRRGSRGVGGLRRTARWPVVTWPRLCGTPVVSSPATTVSWAYAVHIRRAQALASATRRALPAVRRTGRRGGPRAGRQAASRRTCRCYARAATGR